MEDTSKVGIDLSKFGYGSWSYPVGQVNPVATMGSSGIMMNMMTESGFNPGNLGTDLIKNKDQIENSQGVKIVNFPNTKVVEATSN